MTLFGTVIDGLLPLPPWRFAKLIKYLKLLQKKDVDTVNRRENYFFHKEFKYYVGGSSRISGLYNGWPDYRDRIILGEVGTPGKIISIKTSRHSVCLVTCLSGTRCGKMLDLEVIFLFNFKGNKLIEGRSIPLNDAAWSEFWA